MVAVTDSTPVRGLLVALPALAALEVEAWALELAALPLRPASRIRAVEVAQAAPLVVRVLSLSGGW